MVPSGGLFVPETFPQVDLKKLKSLTGYQDVARWLLGLYLTDFESSSLDRIIKDSYSTNFDTQDIAPLVTLRNSDINILELWHGPTAAFKDLALQCMPRLLLYSMAVTEKVDRVLILVATSGDTGMAALDGFCNKDKIDIIVFYPDEGVSVIQKQQMITKSGCNVRAVGVKGNFDMCQTSVKQIFQDEGLVRLARERGCVFSSANSINWGRLAPQIVYYFWAYQQMAARGRLSWGEPVNFCVPTGNFGNILSAYYAMNMGLPVGRLICASNKNNILTDFINTGKYDLDRPFHVTSSPSMDILISSNLERFIFDVYGKNGDTIAGLYSTLQQKKAFSVSDVVKAKMQSIFYGSYASEEEVFTTIKKVYNTCGYLLDTHTAVGYTAAVKYKQQTDDNTPMVLTSTANPYKFPAAVYGAVTGLQEDNDFEVLRRLEQYTGTPVHPALKNIESREVLHTDVIEADEIFSYIEREVTG